MTALIQLCEVKRQPNMDVVEVLEDALRDALAGDLRAVTVAAIRRGGQRTVLVSECDNYAEMLGVLCRAQHVIQKTIDDEVQS